MPRQSQVPVHSALKCNGPESIWPPGPIKYRCVPRQVAYGADELRLST